MKRRLCFVVNPLAGIGGPLALKGSDGEAALIALEQRAKPSSPQRATRFLERLKSLGLDSMLELLTSSGAMGEEEAKLVGLSITVVYRPPKWPTTRLDTITTVKTC
ncbi:MAG TPA: hypothetical protein EYP33_05145, partial [Pyrodictium sp.]|nr:hypothetical protein [Pyrodictium sp.]